MNDENHYPQESYRGPEPRTEGWNWPTTVAFLGFLVFVAFIVWMAFS